MKVEFEVLSELLCINVADKGGVWAECWLEQPLVDCGIHVDLIGDFSAYDISTCDSTLRLILNC